MSPYDGEVSGFFGKVEEGQMPAIMKLPNALSMRQDLAVREVVVASKEEVDVCYGKGPGNPHVPIQGDELVMVFAGPGTAGVNVKVPLL